MDKRDTRGAQIGKLGMSEMASFAACQSWCLARLPFIARSCDWHFFQCERSISDRHVLTGTSKGDLESARFGQRV